MGEQKPENEPTKQTPETEHVKTQPVPSRPEKDPPQAGKGAVHPQS